MAALNNTKITFIGCGAMGEAILKGILNGGLVTKEQVTAAVPTARRQAYLKDTYAIAVTGDNKEAVKDADLVILAVKPQMARAAVTKELVEALPAGARILSIMGSYDLAMLHDLVPDHPVIRTMPNTPLAVGMGMTALTGDDQVSEDFMEAAEAIFNSCGETVRVDEKSMEAITAISGCGPGYLFVVIDALADAGVMAGLPRAMAIRLAAQTMAGSGMMALKTGLHPAQLRDQVTSPGGTTIAGIKALENHGVRGAFYDAVQAVLDRSAALKK
ncbi:MAG: pyrroline-5-carboxylate reductase [Acidaminococcus sp.]|uniref:pyrroline-5-carboxylate reductase n=1 Tax=Acidaminococcus sp. TaxID=1872103 RepID=UPI0026E02312|nr:pyrroline-5-carboxylate reductase [Acidaminococcus sp.]MDO5596813.1 pyrroline-5-carboxylate reductase [Acidaminococcus sp.]